MVSYVNFYTDQEKLFIGNFTRKKQSNQRHETLPPVLPMLSHLYAWPLCANMTSCTTPEVHNWSQHHQSRIESRP